MDWLGELVGRAHAHLAAAPEAQAARDYLISRGVTDADWPVYQIGFSAPSVQIGTCSAEFAKWYPRYWFNRIVFPLTDYHGRVTGVVTRTLPGDSERRSYQQFYAFPPDVYPYLFGLGQAMEAIWTTRQVVIVEGIFDYFAVAREVPNTVAILTANVPQTARAFFKRFTKVVWAALDMDSPGRMGCYRLAGLTPPKEHWPEGWIPTAPSRPDGYRVVILNYTGAKDPGGLWEVNRLEDLTNQLAPARVPAVV